MDDLRALSEEKVNLLCQNAPTKPFSTGCLISCDLETDSLQQDACIQKGLETLG